MTTGERGCGVGVVDNSAFSGLLCLPVSTSKFLPFAWLSGFRAYRVPLFSICTLLCCHIWYLARNWLLSQVLGSGFGWESRAVCSSSASSRGDAGNIGHEPSSIKAVLPDLQFLGACSQVPKFLSQVPREPVVEGKVWMDMADKVL